MLLFYLRGWLRTSSFLTGAGSDSLPWVEKGNGFTVLLADTLTGTLTLFGGKRVLLFCLCLLQLCLVKAANLCHIGLVRHLGCEKQGQEKYKKI